MLITDEINTVHKTGMRFTKMPVEMLVSAPAMRDGRTCSDAPSAEVPWTRWKLGDVSNESCLKVWENGNNSQQTAVQLHAVGKSVCEKDHDAATGEDMATPK